MNVQDHIQKVRSKGLDIVGLTKEVINKIERINQEYNYFSIITKDLALSSAELLRSNPEKLKLAGIFISVKDAICVKNITTHASSKILLNYKPVFDAAVIERIKREGAIIIGKTLQDEFGFGSFSTNTGIGFKIPKNPFDPERATGGSSGGSGGISQKADFPHVSLGESTGGSIVNPASLCGVYGFAPTYGRVSRYGLLDYGSSLDKIGPLSKDLVALAMVLNVIAGRDERDSTTSSLEVPDYVNALNTEFKGRIAVVKESIERDVDEDVKKEFNMFLDQLKQRYKVDLIDMPLAYEYGVPAYYIIALAESSTNLAKYCGIRYGETTDLKGNFNEFFKEVRTKYFGEEAKRRIMLGTFTRMVGFRDAYYIKAMKVRSKIIKEYKDVFRKYDIILTPTTPFKAPKFDDIKNMKPAQIYLSDKLTVGPNLAGLPHLNIPILYDKLPSGVLAIADHFKEDVLLSFAGSIKNIVDDIKK